MLEMAERNPRPRDLTILLLGVTGAGKSTLINMLANTLPGRKYQDQRLFAIPCTQEFEIQVDRRVLAWSRLQACNIEQFKELAAGDAADHRTSSPGIYRFRDTQTGRVVTLVDTPGLGDSRGEMFDELQTQTAVQAVLSVKQVDMVCVVHNATEARLRESTKTALARLREVLGPRAAAITTVCLTHSPKNIAPNCIDALKEAGLPTDNLFRFENSCLVHPDLYSQLCKQELGADHEEAQELAEIGARSWTHNERAAKQLLDRAANSETLDAIDVLSEDQVRKLILGFAPGLDEEEGRLREEQFLRRQELAQLDNKIEQVANNLRPHNKIAEIVTENVRTITVNAQEKKPMNIFLKYWRYIGDNYGSSKRFMLLCSWLAIVGFFVYVFVALFEVNGSRATERYDQLEVRNAQVGSWPIQMSCGAYSIKDVSQPLSVSCQSTNSHVNSTLIYRVESCTGNGEFVNMSYREEKQGSSPISFRIDCTCIDFQINNKLPHNNYRSAIADQNGNTTTVEQLQKSRLVFARDKSTSTFDDLSCTAINTFQDDKFVYHRVNCSGTDNKVEITFSRATSCTQPRSKFLLIIVALVIACGISFIALKIFDYKKGESLFIGGYFVWVDVPSTRNINDWKIKNLDAQKYNATDADSLHQQNLARARETRQNLRNQIQEVDDRILRSRQILIYLLERLPRRQAAERVQVILGLIEDLNTKINYFNEAALSRIFMTANKRFKHGFMWSLRELERRDPDATDLLRAIEEAGCFNDIEVDRNLMNRIEPLWDSYQRSAKAAIQHMRSGLQRAVRIVEEARNQEAQELTDEMKRILEDRWREQMERGALGAVQVAFARETQDPFVIKIPQA